MKVRIRIGTARRHQDYIVEMAVVPRRGERIVYREGGEDVHNVVRRVDHLAGAASGVVACCWCTRRSRP